ncbi:hypothetical protein RUW90_25615, partial [Klebsiella pneumoniae]|nr:hypothetical protein [Klebsiella pneumoniae]
YSAIDQIAQFGLSSLKVIYYSEQLFSATTQQLRFTANYISTAASVTAGAANAVAQVNISYM